MDNILKALKVDIPDEKFDKIFHDLKRRYPDGEDPWGLNLNKARKTLEYIWPLYNSYFQVRVFGQENVRDEPYMVVSNHSGQIAIDATLIATAFATEIDPPRILRSMVERFFTALPWVGTLAAEGGAVLGDRQNCLNLLSRGQSVLVFPEGVRGVAKSTFDFYKLQRFTRGFYRMALTSQIKILPIAVIGAEEIFPWVYQAKGVARLLGLPALPLSPLYLPLPSPVDIIIGEPYEMPDVSPEAPDKEIDIHIDKIRTQIRHMTNEGLKNRRPFFANQNHYKSQKDKN
ncbi:MAG: 1-acyl-sn-glycerol-3-phosphate acyltransferase [Bacteriovoracaceae bacterium]|nr:1-acyl-sn-glycerol-3-phosphate acyltransferase [Bacteriovoracaceae bacterium]